MIVTNKPDIDFAQRLRSETNVVVTQPVPAAWADITGWSIIIPNVPGKYIIRLDFCHELSDANNNGISGASFRLAIDGTGDPTTIKEYSFNGMPNGTTVQETCEYHVEYNFSGGEVITLQGILNTAGDSAQVFGTAATLMARISYELQTAFVNVSYPVYETNWIVCNDWTNQHLGTVVGGTVIHNLNASLSDLLVKVMISTDGTDGNSWETKGWIYAGGAAAYGVELQAIDDNSFIVQTGASGVDYLDNNGTPTVVPNGLYYKIKVFKLT